MSAIHTSKTSGDNPSRAQTPLTLAVESPSRANVSSTTKSWCSSPFFNLDALSPEENSLSFSLADFSPTMSFSSPRLKFQEQASPQSASCRQKDHYSSIFSPSIFSPFNKSLKPHKMDKIIDGDYLDTDLPHYSPSKANLPSPDDSSHALLSSIGYRGYTTSDIPGVHFDVNGRGLKVEDDEVDVEVQSSYDDSVLTDDIALRMGDSPATSRGGSLLGLIYTSGSRGRRSEASHRAAQLSPNIQPPLSDKTPGSGSSGSDLHNSVQWETTSVPPDPTPPTLSSNSSSTVSRQHSSFASSAPTGKNVPFSSPAVLAKAKQSIISPTVARGTCNCKKSKCLKLYCECFAALRYCDCCNCMDCSNCKEHEDLRQEAIQATKERNPAAFQLKVSVKKGHMAGCNCKKSQCLKKYCECFEGSVFCGGNCKCKTCENFGGSEKLKEAKAIAREKRERHLARPGEEGGTTAAFLQPVGPSSTDTPPTDTIMLPSPLSASSIASSGIAVSTSSSTVTSTASTPFKARSRRYASPLSSSAPGSGSNDSSVGRTLSAEKCLLVGGVQKALGGYNSAVSSPSSSNLSLSPGDSVQANADSSCSSGNGIPPLKKRRVDVQQGVAEYPFFGPKCPRMTKLTTLQCLEFLDGPNLFAVSLVSRLMNQAAMDDALWE